MPSLFPEIFLGSSLLLLLVSGSILMYSPQYNHPIFCFQNFTSCILVWFFILCRYNIAFDADPSFVCDNLSMYTKTFICFGALGVLAVGKTRKIKVFEYYVLVLLGFLGLSLICSSLDLVAVYLCLELQTLAFYILTTFQVSSSFSTEAGLKYFLLGAISSALLLFGVSFVYGFSGTTNLEDLAILNIQHISSDYASVSVILQGGLLLFSLGLLFKLGAVPFHLWLPDVYEGAPSSVTTLFAVVPKLSIFVVLLRLMDAVHLPMMQGVFLVLAFLSLVLGSMLALFQKKLKRLLAFSGISHVGYALLALSTNTIDGMSATLIYLVFYILTSLFLWGLVLSIENPKGRTLHLSDLVGWGRAHPFLSFSACGVVFSLAGIPPLGGFFAKFAVFVASADLSLYLALCFGLLASSIGVLYYLRLIKLLHFEETKWHRPLALQKAHVFFIGLAAFFLVFFLLFGDLFYFICYNISLSF
jgi:NADH-quinone oxidoreductase subunit N